MPARASLLPAIAPIILQLRDTPFDDPAWLFEPKFDGFRGTLYLDGTAATFVSKQRKELPRFAAFAEEVRRMLGVRSAILDGEIVAFDDAGQHSFKSLMSHQGDLHYAAFDLLWLNGKDLRSLSLTKRRQQLERLIPSTSPTLSHVMAVSESGKALFGATQQLDLEGIVAKRLGDPYDESTVWYKIKNRAYSQMTNRFERFQKR